VEEQVIASYFNKKLDLESGSGIGSSNSMPCLCFWSTNVVTLWDSSKQEEPVQVPKQVIDKEEEHPGLMTENSEWYTKVSQFLDSIELDDENEGSEDDSKAEMNGHVNVENGDLPPDCHEETSHSPIQSTSFDEVNEQPSPSKLPISFTFRADLPQDLPPSVNATCARYFYSAVVVARTVDGKVSTY
jgi:hypothetical protein